MFSSSTLGALLGAILLISSIPDASSYTKYGRTCKDIGCRRDEVCVMAEDPCSLYQPSNCGRYPTCAKSHPGGASCAGTVCGENEYCKTENGMPVCVKKSTDIDDELFAEFNGDNKIIARRQSTSEMASQQPDSSSTKSRDTQSGYPAASGYPSSGDSAKSSYPSSQSQPNPADSSSRTSGYPSSSGYPSNSGYPSRSSSSGYPSGYPSSGSGYPSQSAGYPSRSSSGYPTQSGYPSRSSGYPSGSSGYPSGSYPSSNSRGYPSSSGYPGSSPTNEQSVQRVNANSVNSAYPGYPSQGQATNYPSQNSGYPGQANQYGNYYPGYNQGRYPQGYQQGGYPAQGNYPQGYPQGYPGGYQQGYPGYQQGYYPPPSPTTKKPNFGDQLTNIAKDLAGKVLTQAIIDKVAG